MNSSSRYREVNPGGLSHSEIHGSAPACGSPWLIATCYVLHRLLAPRHSPFALSSLITKFTIFVLSLRTVCPWKLSELYFLCPISISIFLSPICSCQRTLPRSLLGT